MAIDRRSVTQVEPRISSLSCEVCNRKFVKEQGLQAHLRMFKDHKEKVDRLQAFFQGHQSVQIPPPVLSNMVPETQAISTLQSGMAAIQLNNTTPNCGLCDRVFVTEKALQSHMENSKVHKKEVKRQEKEPIKAATLTPGTLSSTILYGHQSHGQAINMKNYQAASLPAFQPQAPNNGIYGAYQPSHLRQPDLVPAGISMFSTTQHTSGEIELSFDYNGRSWSVISASEQPAQLEALKDSCHSAHDLQKNKYLLRPYGPDDIAGLRRCANCEKLHKDISARAQTECIFHPGVRQTRKRSDGPRPYLCCGKENRGCACLPEHMYLAPDQRLATKYREYTPTPSPSPWKPKRQAVTLDCEMAGVKGGMSEVILLCVADYFTGETLVNSLVRPKQRVVDWRTRYSGVTEIAMAAAIAQGRTLNGWKGARDALWEHIDAETILVGHALQHDLDILRTIHTRIVDSSILTKLVVRPKCARSWSLKALCEAFLHIDIQNQGRKGHDCLEDALAAREVVLWCMRNPQELAEWGIQAGEDERRKSEERAKAQERRKEEKKTVPTLGKSRARGMHAYADDDDYSDEGGMMRWEDIAEDCGYPHPDTGYDPWSD
ncbi:hypothetical protein MMC30_003926 [Trapelia coarctata]|nr:hypothetical protein [Trapelia coarctata]